MLYSATWPKKVRALANEFLKTPATVHIGNTSNELVASKTITQIIKVVPRYDKKDTFMKLLEAINTEPDGTPKKKATKTIIFTGTKRFCDELAKDIRTAGTNARCIHGDMEQWQRDQVLMQFKTDRIPVLVATDVAARGLDVPDIEYVINYDFPHGCGARFQAGFTPEECHWIPTHVGLKLLHACDQCHCSRVVPCLLPLPS
jgi:ATP-dependent RNA helicase DDX5/DBP2